MNSSQQTVWEKIYADGQANMAPWTHAVTFMFSESPKNIPRNEIRILEVGCGTASNIFFAAQMGFRVAGIDFAPSAIDFAKKRFQESQLVGDLRVADAAALPFDDNSFDLVLDRAALCSCPESVLVPAVKEAYRCLKPKGKFFFNPYSSRSSSAASGQCADGRLVGGYRTDITEGVFTDIGGVCFFDESEIQGLLTAAGFCVKKMEHVEIVDVTQPLRSISASWRVTAVKE